MASSALSTFVLSECKLATPSPVPRGLTHIFIPKLSCSFPLRVHPLYESIRDEYDACIVRLAVPKTEEEKLNILSEKLTLLTCTSFPGVVNERFHLIVKLVIWSTLLDNSMDNVQGLGEDVEAASQLINKYLSIIDGSAVDEEDLLDKKETTLDDRLLTFFASLWRCFQDELPQAHFATMKEVIHSMFTLQVGHSKSRKEDCLPSVTELMHEKSTTGLYMVALKIFDYLMGLEDQKIHNDPELIEFYQLAANCMLICNELLSFRVEYLANDFCNMLCAVCVHENKTLNEAALELQFMWDAKLKQLDILQRRLVLKHGPAMERLVQEIGTMITGYVEWCWQTGRYHGRDWTAPSQREGVMILKEAKTCATFLPSPSLE